MIGKIGNQTGYSHPRLMQCRSGQAQCTLCQICSSVTHSHTHPQAETHAHSHTCVHAQIHAHAHTQAHADTHVDIQTAVHTTEGAPWLSSPGAVARKDAARVPAASFSSVERVSKRTCVDGSESTSPCASAPRALSSTAVMRARVSSGMCGYSNTCGRQNPVAL
jgi:hypothetical protein